MRKHLLLYVNNSTTNKISKFFLTVVHIAIRNSSSNGDIRGSLKYWTQNFKTSLKKQHILYLEDNKYSNYRRVSPASKTNLMMKIQNLWLESTFPVTLYKPEKDPTVDQISEKDVQCFLCLVVSILNYERETNQLFIF